MLAALRVSVLAAALGTRVREDDAGIFTRLDPRLFGLSRISSTNGV
jgi:hypothetical protein